MPAAVGILADDRRRLTRMLTSVRHLGDVAARVLNASHDDLVANLRHLRPTLDKLSRVGRKIPNILSVLITYPTADSVEQEYFGDYGNLSLTLDVSAESLLNTFGPGTLPAGGDGAGEGHGGGGDTGPGGDLPSLPVPLPTRTPSAPLTDLLLGGLS